MIRHLTRIMLNSVKPRVKNSKVAKKMVREIIIIFIVQLILCLFSSIFNVFWSFHYDVLQKIYFIDKFIYFLFK